MTPRVKVVLRRNGARSRHGGAELSTSCHSELRKDPVEVRPDGARRQDELPAYLAIRHALSDQAGNLELLRRQPSARSRIGLSSRCCAANRR